MAMAPLDAPTIALAVVVENAGFGSEAAAPIARRVFDQALLGLYPSEEDMAATRIGKSSAPIGRQRRAEEVPLPGAAGVMGALVAAPAVPTAATPPAAPAAAASAASAPQRVAGAR
jgi:penicillin-binding protein 2